MEKLPSNEPQDSEIEIIDLDQDVPVQQEDLSTALEIELNAPVDGLLDFGTVEREMSSRLVDEAPRDASSMPSKFPVFPPSKSSNLHGYMNQFLNIASRH